MEIPVINRLINFEARMISPSFLLQIVTFTGIENLLQAYSCLWKWIACILVLLASFTTVVNRIRILVIRFKFQADQSLPTKPLMEDDDYDSESDSSCSSSDDEEDEPAGSPSSSKWRTTEYQDFRVSGSAHYIDDRWKNSELKRRRRCSSSCSSFRDLFSLSEIANKKSVVKLWDNLSNLALGIDLNRNSFGDEIDTAGLDIGSIFGWNSKISAVPASPTPAVVVSASTNESKNVQLKVWDTRAAFQLPAIVAEWKPTLGKIVGVYTGGVEKVYVRDDVCGDLTVGDMRKASSLLENLMKSDVETWWDADAGDEAVDGMARTEGW